MSQIIDPFLLHELTGFFISLLHGCYYQYIIDRSTEAEELSILE